MNQLTETESPVPVDDAFIQVDSLRLTHSLIPLLPQPCLKLSPTLSEFDVLSRIPKIYIVPGEVACGKSAT